MKLPILDSLDYCIIKGSSNLKPVGKPLLVISRSAPEELLGCANNVFHKLAVNYELLKYLDEFMS